MHALNAARYCETRSGVVAPGIDRTTSRRRRRPRCGGDGARRGGGFPRARGGGRGVRGTGDAASRRRGSETARAEADAKIYVDCYFIKDGRTAAHASRRSYRQASRVSSRDRHGKVKWSLTARATSGGKSVASPAGTIRRARVSRGWSGRNRSRSSTGDRPARHSSGRGAPIHHRD